MRLAGIGLLSLLLIAALILLGLMGAFDTAFNKLSGNDRQSVADYQLAATHSFDVSGTDVFVAQVSTDAAMILSGLPSYASAQYRMPMDSRPVSGTYRLNFSSRVADGVEGALRVSINGVRRAEILLSEGIRREGVDIELTSGELSASQLDVRLSLQGRGEIAECTPEDSIAAVLEIDADSGLELALSSPVETARDKLALWGGRVPVAWRSGGDQAVAMQSLISAARLSAKGYRPHFMGEGMSGDELARISANAVPMQASYVPDAYPLALVSDTSNQGVRKFGRRVSWRYSYDEQDLPDGVLPAALDLRLLVGPQASELSREVTVTVNDNLLFSKRIPADVERFNQSILIPANAQRASNSLEIAMSVGDSNNQRCGEIEQTVAQLLPETVLRQGSRRAGDALSVLRNLLAAGSTVSLTSGELTGADAEAAMLLLSRLNPAALDFTTGEARSSIRIAVGTIASLRDQAGGAGEDWIVYAPYEQGQELVVRPLGEIGTAEEPAIALIVTVPAQASDGESSLVTAR